MAVGSISIGYSKSKKSVAAFHTFDTFDKRSLSRRARAGRRVRVRGLARGGAVALLDKLQSQQTVSGVSTSSLATRYVCPIQGSNG